ncbi:hypothetical protein [Leucobacter chromiireducens]|uniref:hypothetical protein n=1 Tax=Leucobacter chromiireducens TaxID=283877 RepID=UPI000F62C5A2|nr:hypothetical protein [Leucobacter chromiireducens]
MEDAFTAALRQIIRDEVDAALRAHLGKPTAASESVPKGFRPQVRMELIEELRRLNNAADIVFADDAARYLGISRHKLDEMRKSGTGPSVYMFFTRVAYKREVLERYKTYRDGSPATPVPQSDRHSMNQPIPRLNKKKRAAQ